VDDHGLLDCTFEVEAANDADCLGKHSMRKNRILSKLNAGIYILQYPGNNIELQ